MPDNEIQKYVELLKKVVLEYSPKIIFAFLILFIGLWTTSIITKLVKRVLKKRHVEETLANFVGNLLFWTLRILVFITFISKLGVETSSFVAILGAAGLAIGLALQGSLSNFAGGILIILFKPFKVEDVIETQGSIGVVKEIQIFNTRLLTADNKTIYIPNGILSNGVVTNYTQEGIRRVDLVIGVDYNSDLQLVKNTIKEVMAKNTHVLKEPEATAFVLDLADSSINMGIRPWAKAEDYFKVRSEILEECKIAFDKVNIEIPFPHQVEIKKK
ncbi:MAG: small conductance mechanosensitive channel [Flavobacterium sp.]|jgi:small conductance mechanosensitive channel